MKTLGGQEGLRLAVLPMRSLSKDGDRKKNEAYEEEERDSGPRARSYGCLKRWPFGCDYARGLACGPCE